MHKTAYLELSGTRHFLENSADHHCIIILHHQDTVVIQTQAKSTENSKLHMPLFGEFGRSSRDLCHHGEYNAMNPGTIGWIRPKVASEFSIFKWLKNREDGSDFDDFWTELIASVQTFFPKFSRGRKNYRGEKKIAAMKKFRNARTIERTRCQKVPGKRCSRVVIDGYKIDAVMCFENWPRLRTFVQKDPKNFCAKVLNILCTSKCWHKS